MSSTATDARNQAIKESGCIACLLVNRQTQAPDVHHLTAGSRRTGDTVGLCPYHHRGLIPEGHTAQSISGLLGPSYSWGRRPWTEFFCNDTLLLEIQDLILEEFAKTPWFDYTPYYEVRRKARTLWMSKTKS